MIKSMTGYGRGEYSLHNRKFTVEIKSVNHRYNDISIKLPRVMNTFEDKIRKKMGEEVSRGKTDVYISFETFSKEDIRINLNTALSDAYVDELNEIRKRYSIADPIRLDTIARFPDIITVDKSMDDQKTMEEMWETLEAALLIALEQFVRMRQAEGSALKNDITTKAGLISGMVGKIKARAPLLADEYRERLRARLSEALGDPAIDETRLLQEIAIFADKSCIDEEITRLESHIIQLEDILNERDSVGRKLDFLVQEMNREVNTIGSKSNDIEITKIVVNLKSEVEKVREQVQNIE